MCVHCWKALHLQCPLHDRGQQNNNMTSPFRTAPCKHSTQEGPMDCAVKDCAFLASPRELEGMLRAPGTHFSHSAVSGKEYKYGSLFFSRSGNDQCSGAAPSLLLEISHGTTRGSSLGLLQTNSCKPTS